MAGGLNLASKYAKNVNERFSRVSQVGMALNNDYEFTGVKTVNVYSIPTAPLTDYVRSGTNRYGTPSDQTRNVQTLTVNRDRAFTYVIDKGDKIQSQMVSDAGKSLSRQIREVVVPEYDTYVLKTLAAAATARGAIGTTAATKSNAYELFLAGQETLGNKNVPDGGRIAFCSYKFANLLKLDPAFMKYGNLSQEMVLKGVLGEVDGTRIVKVPSSRLPAGAAFILTHPVAACGPKQLEEFKIHENPQGLSGWLVEGRVIYDCFVLNESADAVYFHGSQAVLRMLNITTAASNPGKSTVLINPALKDSATNKWYYCTATAPSGLIELTHGSAITVGNWVELTASGVEIEPTATHTAIRVVEVGSDNKPLAYGDAVLHIG